MVSKAFGGLSNHRLAWLYNQRRAAMQGQVRVTPARWWHMPGLSRLIRETRRQRAKGYIGALVWAPRWSPSLGLLQSAWASSMPGGATPRSLVVERDGRPVGLAQISPRREPRQWEIVYLAIEDVQPAVPELASDGQARSGALWIVRDRSNRTATRLLGEVCDAAVAGGGERLFARIDEQGGRLDLFRQVGFSTVSHEYTYFHPLEPGAVNAQGNDDSIEGLRPQRKPDSFAIFQLYQQCTPKIVQMVEGKQSKSWDLPPRGLGPRLIRHPRVRRWVVERDSRLVAWVEMDTFRRGPHTLQLMVDERFAQLNDPLIRFALRTLAARGGGGVLVRTQEHQQLLMTALEDAALYLIDAHLLIVKQLAAPVLQAQFAPALEKVV